MFDWLKSFIQNRVVSLAIGFIVAKAGSSGLEAHGVTVDTTKLQAYLFAGYQAFAHWIEGKTVGGKWDWLGKVL